MLLPHEKSWIQKIRQQAAELNSDTSLALLEKSPFLTGYTGQLKAELIHTRLLLDAGRDLEAQQRLSSIDTAAMTQKEKMHYQSLKALFYYQTGDLKAFTRQTEEWDKEAAVHSTEITLLKAQALQEQGELAAARDYLEARIERERRPEQLSQLYNHLANLEGLAGRHRHQLGHLETAWRYWRQAPEPGAMHSTAHNLVISKIRQGQSDEARRIVMEVYRHLDHTSPEQVLMWHNLSLEAARELGDSNWVQQTYADFDMHCQAMTLTNAQQVALAVTRLRMELNDGLLSEVDSYAERITKLLDRVHLLPETDQLPALKEITHNLEQVMQRVSNMRQPLDDYLQVYTRCDQMVLDRAHPRPGGRNDPAGGMHTDPPQG